jgi:hypothetical protein
MVMDKFTLSQHGMRERVCVCVIHVHAKRGSGRGQPGTELVQWVCLWGVRVNAVGVCGSVAISHLTHHAEVSLFVCAGPGPNASPTAWPLHAHAWAAHHSRLTHTHTYPLRALHQLTAAAFTAARPLSTLMGPAQAAQNNSTHSQWRKCNPLHEMPALTDNKQLIFVTPWTHSVPTVVLVMAASAMQLANGLLHVFVSRLGSYRCV